MGIPIEKNFVVHAPAQAVWEFLTDPRKVAGCLPGAAITEQLDEQSYAGTITVKVGPVTASYRGKMRFERLDPVAREAEIVGSGQETKGKGGADMRMKSRVVETGPNETEVTVTSDVNVVGVLAQFGRGMIQDVSDQLFRKFTEAMRRDLEAPVEPVPAPAAAVPGETAAAPVPAAPAPPTPAPPKEEVLDVGALGAQAAGRAAVRFFQLPGFWLIVVLAVLLYWWLSRSAPS